MNPLSLPWGNKRKEVPISGPPVPNYIGLRNEVARANVGVQHRVTIEIRGIKGMANSQYVLEYSAGSSLKHYLHQLKLQNAAVHSAVRDLTNMEKGRLRLSYVPAENAHIVLGNPDMSSVHHLQRSSVDTNQVMARMGPDKVVERKMR